MTGPEEPDNLTSMESATETIKRIFEGSTSPVGACGLPEAGPNAPDRSRQPERWRRQNHIRGEPVRGLGPFRMQGPAY